MSDENEDLQGLGSDFDLITYAGRITREGYEELSRLIAARKKHDVALIALATPGGNPHSGFRIARALGCAYDRFHALVPRYCKSAGTLILIGASGLYLDDMSELGPLDVQVKKGDEIVGQNSGLEFIKAMNYLQAQSMDAFRSSLMDLTAMGLSTRIASDIAATLTVGLFEPISGQVDPLKLAEMQRATEIAYEYGLRLAEKSGNMRAGGLPKLVAGYPSHGFVIDRAEARTIFINVQKPTGLLAELSTALRAEMQASTDSGTPEIKLMQISLVALSKPEDQDDETPTASSGDASRSATSGEQSIHGDFPGAQQSRDGDTPSDAGSGHNPAANDPDPKVA